MKHHPPPTPSDDGYEMLAWLTALHSLGKVEVEYGSAKERRKYEGAMALVRIREKQAGTWRRPAYGAPTDDHHIDCTSPHGIPRTRVRRRGARPVVRGASRRSSAKSGDSGGDDGPCESPASTSEALRLLAERLRALDVFVAEYGLDYWDTHTTAPDATAQLGFEELEA